MINGCYLNGKNVRKKYNVAPSTLRRWASLGKIEYKKSPLGRRYYNMHDVDRAFGHELPKRRKIRYARVSSSHQVGDLKRQVADIEEAYPDYDETITDVGSGLNWKRKGFTRILEQVHGGLVSHVVVLHKDRLCRFGFELVEWILEKASCELVVHGKEDDPHSATELADDLLAVVTVFVARHHGNRAAENRKRRREAKEKAHKDKEEERRRKRVRCEGDEDKVISNQEPEKAPEEMVRDGEVDIQQVS